ncbi:MAG: ankyrin repeat domain-containing protein [Mycobacterium sp.]|nr:ankyrin repeat domain-containing protein [Mycobacterium sp.]
MTGLDEFGRSPLHYAALDGDPAIVERLLATEDVNLADREGWTPLHFAARMGRADVVTRLLDAGADVNAVTDKGMDAIYWAAAASTGEPARTVRALRQRGADPTRKTIKSYFGPKSTLEYIADPRAQRDPAIMAEFADLIPDQ